mgnify:CR=1 FL=1
MEKKLMNIRAGKANPNMLSNVTIEYYGTNTPLSQVANINTPDGRTIIIQPWEKTILPEIEKGIEIEKKQISFPNGALKVVGEHAVDVHLYDDMHHQLTINISALESKDGA